MTAISVSRMPTLKAAARARDLPAEEVEQEGLLGADPAGLIGRSEASPARDLDEQRVVERRRQPERAQEEEDRDEPARPVERLPERDPAQVDPRSRSAANPCAIRSLKSPICSANQSRTASRIARINPDPDEAARVVGGPAEVEGRPERIEARKQLGDPAQATSELATTKSKRLSRMTVEAIVA